MALTEAALAAWLQENRWRILEDPHAAAAALLAVMANPPPED